MAWYSVFTGLFKGSTAANIANAAIEGLDNFNFSEEEKAKYQEKMMGVWIKVQEATANENSKKSVTRRIIAVSIVSVYLAIILAGCIAYKFDPEYSEFLFKVAGSQNFFVTSIMIFYFGYYAYTNILKAKKDK